jgi:hypothetical protein
MSTNPDAIPQTRAEFERALQQLTRAYGARQDNPASYKSDDSERCVQCMFTTRSRDCFHCTYCAECAECTDCTHCTRTTHSHSSSYCVDAHHCVKCSYVLMSRHCYECLFCFGCVGLAKKEFHILNMPFSRTTYFKLVAELKAQLGLS